MKKNLPWIILATMATLSGLVLAIYNLQTQLVFGFDQARDAFEAFSIWHDHHLKILGPATDIPGVFHGVLWYYFLAVAYFIGRTPLGVGLISLFIFFLSFVPFAILTQRLFQNIPLTCVVISIYILSPLFQAFTRWLSNPSLALMVTPLLLLILWKYIDRPSGKNSFLVGALFGLLIQTDFAYVIQLFVIPFYFLFFRLKFRIANFLAFVFGILLTTSSYIISDFRFSGRTFTSLLSFLSKGGSNAAVSDALHTLFNHFFEMLSIVVFPWPKLIIVILFFFLYLFLRNIKFQDDKKPLIFHLIWLFGFVLLQIFSSAGSGSAHILAAFIFSAIAIGSYFLVRLFKIFPKSVLILPIIFIGSLSTQIHWAKAGYSPLSVQRGMYYHQEEKLVDYTYSQAQGKPFILNSITNPLYINTLWASLYQFYGQEKYHYLPFWGGRDQAGYLGRLPQKPFGENLRFLIIEDPSGIPSFYLAKSIYEEDKVSDVVEEKSFGNVQVQKRIFHPDKGPIPLPMELKRATPDLLE